MHSVHTLRPQRIRQYLLHGRHQQVLHVNHTSELAYCLLPTAYSLLTPTYYLKWRASREKELVATYYLLPPTYYPLLTTPYSLRATP